jgi:hypothetical protein
MELFSYIGYNKNGFFQQLYLMFVIRHERIEQGQHMRINSGRHVGDGGDLLCGFSYLFGVVDERVRVGTHPRDHGSITFAGVARDATMHGVIVSTKVLCVGFLIHNDGQHMVHRTPPAHVCQITVTIKTSDIRVRERVVVICGNDTVFFNQRFK